ncbi:hypothetical protein EON64_14565, partial [archaeon]
MLGGFLSGNLGVMKSFLTEITDTTNRGKGFAYVSVSWSLGSMIAPLIGMVHDVCCMVYGVWL